jgi:hypothetical protein
VTDRRRIAVIVISGTGYQAIVEATHRAAQRLRHRGESA